MAFVVALGLLPDSWRIERSVFAAMCFAVEGCRGFASSVLVQPLSQVSRVVVSDSHVSDRETGG